MKKTILFLTLASSLFLVSCGGGSSSASSGAGKLAVPSGDNIYFGSFPDFGGAEEFVSVERIQAFENLVGKKIAWATFSQNWYNGIVYPQAQIDAVRQSGATPYVRLMPRSDEIQGHAEGRYNMQNIINGEFDNALKAWADAAKNDGLPLLVDFAVEPNGDWFSWSGVFNGGGTTDGYGDPSYPDGPERYRDAYRHIIDIFNAEGVTNVTWFFHFNLASLPNVAWNQPKYYYPGDAYIDWIGFSAYGAQEVTEEWAGLEFSTQLRENYGHIVEMGSQRPLAVLEFGVTDHHPHGSKSAWLSDAFSTILSNPYVSFKAMNPWHENWENEDGTFSTIRLDSSPETLATAREWIGNERFISGLRF